MPAINLPSETQSASSLHKPRIVVYHQTHVDDTNTPVSILPLLINAKDDGNAPSPTITHLIIAAIHLNPQPGDLTLNDDPPSHPRHSQLWTEVMVAQQSGVKVLAMLGGAAHGSFTRLDISLMPGQFEPDSSTQDERFEIYYTPLRDMLREYQFDGIDLDVEEAMTLPGITRLIYRLRTDFGPNFLITLAPVATALRFKSADPLAYPAKHHLSGFDYDLLEWTCGAEIAWYNTQFYNGWGSLESMSDFEEILASGWRRDKVVLGVLTNRGNGPGGFVPWDTLGTVLRNVVGKVPGFGGVMGWEYFNSEPGGRERPWEWAETVKAVLDEGNELR